MYVVMISLTSSMTLYSAMYAKQTREPRIYVKNSDNNDKYSTKNQLSVYKYINAYQNNYTKPLYCEPSVCKPK